MRLPPRKKKPTEPGCMFTPPPKPEVTPRHALKGDMILGVLKGRGVRFDSLLVPFHVFARFPEAHEAESRKFVTPSGITILASDVVPNWECAAYLLGELVAYVELEDYRE